MELKPGYKRTEAGVIPTDWSYAKLDEISLMSSGTTPARSLANRYYRNGTTPWVKTLDLNNAEIFETDECVTTAAVEETSLRPYPVGSVLVAMYGGFNQIGRTGLLRVPAAVNQAITAIQPNRTELHPEFLLATLNFKVDYWKAVASSSRKDPNITSQDIRSFPLAYPSVVEQQAIATTLRDVDALISSLDSLIAKKRDIKQATMQQLLTGKQRLPGFSGEWQMKRLKELGTTYGGLIGKNKDDFTHGTAYYVPFVNVIANVVIDCEAFDTVNVCIGETQNRVLKDDLLFNGSSETPDEVAMCALVAHDIDDLYLNSFCFGFRLKSDAQVNGLFMAYYLRGPVGRDLIKSLAQGSTRYNLSKVALLDAVLQLPGKAEQTAIASVLSDMDTEIAALEHKRDKTRALKQGMMQELLTGRIRLV
ncbi:restriction endonuclease subunit S [Burkholderia sp. Ed8]|uniref:restriction endonuclease subunit S n=1 Tax=Burkholderia sp. Ed8 TaxID=3112957 RepID=UPI00345CE977